MRLHSTSVATGLAILLGCSSSQVTAPVSLRDFDGNSYRTIRVGTHLWFAENLRAIHSPEGRLLSSSPPDNDESNVPEFGRLYSFQAAMNACPAGWRLPTDADWADLEAHLDVLPGVQLRDHAHWPGAVPIRPGQAQFGARPAGYANNEGFDNYFRSRAVFWTSTRLDEHLVWSRVLGAEGTPLRRAPQHSQYGFSVRCVSDLHPRSHR